MKKLIQLVEVRLMRLGPDKGFQLSFVDYRPETENVDPRVDQFRQLIKENTRALPKDTAKVLEGIMDLSQALGASGGSIPMSYSPNGWFVVSQEQYEELGSPMVGDLLSLVLTKTEVPE